MMRKIVKSLTFIALCFFLSAPFTFAQSEFADDWLGTWTVKMLDGSTVTWEITETWVSDTGKSHMALGIRYPEEVEFQIYFGKMFMQYFYIEVSHEKTVYDLPMDMSLYTELVPDEGFIRFNAQPGPYPIDKGYKGDVGFEPEPCAMEYLLDDDDPRLDLVRQFRDEKMATTTAGTYLIKMYYDKSDEVICLCEKNPAFKKSLQLMLEVILADL